MSCGLLSAKPFHEIMLIDIVHSEASVAGNLSLRAYTLSWKAYFLHPLD